MQSQPVDFQEYSYGSYENSDFYNYTDNSQRIVQESTIQFETTSQPPLTKTDAKDCTKLNEQCVCDHVEQEGLSNIFTYTSLGMDTLIFSIFLAPTQA